MILPSFHDLTGQIMGKIVIWSINRPQCKNSLSLSVMRQILDALIYADGENELKISILTGKESYFSSAKIFLRYLS